MYLEVSYVKWQPFFSRWNWVNINADIIAAWLYSQGHDAPACDSVPSEEKKTPSMQQKQRQSRLIVLRGWISDSHFYGELGRVCDSVDAFV